MIAARIAEMILDTRPRTTISRKTIHFREKPVDQADDRFLQPVVEKVDQKPEEKHDLDDPDRDTENARDMQRGEKRFLTICHAPAGLFSGDGNKAGKGQGRNTAGKEEYFEVMLDAFHPEREDEDEDKMTSNPMFASISMDSLRKHPALPGFRFLQKSGTPGRLMDSFSSDVTCSGVEKVYIHLRWYSAIDHIS